MLKKKLKLYNGRFQVQTRGEKVEGERRFVRKGAEMETMSWIKEL